MSLHTVGLAFVLAASLPAAQESPSLPDRARDVFRIHCVTCHGPDKNPRAGLKVLDRAQLVDKEWHLVVPGKPDESELLQLVECGSMPPGIKRKVSEADRQVLRDWIAQGAADFPPHTGEPYILSQIQADVSRTPNDLANVRYISLNHLLDDPDAAKDLDIYRAALIRALNLLSSKEQLVTKLNAIDPDNTIFRIRIDAFGWEKTPFKADPKAKEIDPAAINLYDLVLLEYPFAASPVNARQTLVQSYLKPANLLRPIPYIRGDWFVAVATQAPLYNELLQLPASVRDLERQLELKATPRRRAGLTESKYLRLNRILERGESDKGVVYWRTFDLAGPKTVDALLQVALAEPPKHAGGEAIFSLPNGLPGFFTADVIQKDAKGWRLDAIPKRRLKPNDTVPAEGMRNGLSCLRCHGKGLAPFADVVFKNADSAMDAEKLKARYASLDNHLNDDNQRFATALDKLLPAPAADPLRFVADQFARNTVAAVVPPIDGLTFFDNQPAGDRVKVALSIVDKATGKTPPEFHPGETLTINLQNTGSQAISYELIATNFKGIRFTLEKGDLAAGKVFVRDLPIGDEAAQEQLTVFAAEAKPPPAVALVPAVALIARGEEFPRRLVYTLYKIDKDDKTVLTLLDPARVVKKTVTFETVVPGSDK